MPVQSLKTTIVDKRVNPKPVKGSKIKNVDGSTYAEVSSDAAFDRENPGEKQKINSTGYFGTKVSEG
mgnify:FL=1|jgi:hypothetical protein